MNYQEDHYLERFKEWLTIKGHTTATINSFSGTVNQFLTWLDSENIHIEQVGYNDILAYVNFKKQQGNKQNTQASAINAIKHFFSFLQHEDDAIENPASNVNIKGIKRIMLHEVLSKEELEELYRGYAVTVNYQPGKNIPPQGKSELARKRNKVMLGMIIYQGIRSEELGKLELSDLQLQEGKITIQGSSKTEGRTLKLEGQQIYDLMDYIRTTRKEILAVTNKISSKLFISTGQSANFHNVMQKLLEAIQVKHPQIKNIRQLRASVIAGWFKHYNLRKVQYMAGHRFVSSTERYRESNLEELKGALAKYHPLSGS